MEQERRYEKNVEVKETQFGAAKRGEEAEVQARQPSTAAYSSRGEHVARKSGEAVGSGLRKISKVLGEFAAGVSKELRPRKSSSEGERRIEQRTERAEASPTEVTEKERIESRATRETTERK